MPSSQIRPDWERTRVFVALLLKKRHTKLALNLEAVLASHGTKLEYLANQTDIWVRDNHPIPLRDGTLLRYNYGPPYIRAKDRPKYITPPDKLYQQLQTKLPDARYTEVDVNFEGGNLTSDGTTALSTMALLQDNPDGPLYALNDMEQATGTKFELIPHDQRDMIPHADAYVRYIAPGKVIRPDFSAVSPRLNQALERAIIRAGATTVGILPYEPPESDLDATGAHINFLYIRGLVVFPQFGGPGDKATEEVLRTVVKAHAPGTDVVPLFVGTGLSKTGGVLNCCTYTV